MSEEILVSVICAAYNHEKYIQKCLDGFVMQKTDFKFEVFVHDDASTDKTAEIIKEYAEKYPDIIKPIYQTENQFSKGVPIGKTFIYPKTNGKYITICEGDDYWCSEYKLQKQFDFLEKNPNIFAVAHRNSIVDEDNNILGYSHTGVELNKYFGKKDALSQRSGLFHPCTVMFHNYYLENPKEFEEVSKLKNIGGHSCLIFYCAYKSDIYIMDEPMSAWRKVIKKNGDNFQSVFNDKPVSTRLSILKMYCNYREYFKDVYNFNMIINDYITSITKAIIKDSEPDNSRSYWFKQLFSTISKRDLLVFPFIFIKRHILKEM